MAVAAELAGQGSAPGTGTDDGCLHFVSPLLKKYVFSFLAPDQTARCFQCRKIARAAQAPGQDQHEGPADRTAKSDKEAQGAQHRGQGSIVGQKQPGRRPPSRIRPTRQSVTRAAANPQTMPLPPEAQKGGGNRGFSVGRPGRPEASPLFADRISPAASRPEGRKPPPLPHQ